VDDGGMDMRDLKDSLSKVPTAVEELIQSQQILAICSKDNAPKTLFHNEMQLDIRLEPDFKEMWHSLKIPDETDLPRELEKAGLKTMEVFEKKVAKAEPKLKKAKQRNRRVKITNTHLEGIDLTKDYDANA